MDNYREEIVVKKNRIASNMLYGVLMVLMVLLALIAAILLASLQLNVVSIASFIITGGLAFLIFWKKDTLRTEYEYTFTNGVLDFARVLGNNKRKELGSMNVKNVESCGYVENSSSFQRYITMRDVKKDNWFLNRDSDLFYFFFKSAKDDKKRIIIIEPSEEMTQLIKQYCQRGVYQS